MRFSDLSGMRIGLWGLGRETRSLMRQVAARLPSARITVVAADAGISEADAASLGEGVQVVSGNGVAAALLGCDVVVRSPGVSIYTPAARAVIDGGVPLTTATALWLAEDPSRNAVGVTGTKGKSTTSTLLAHLAGAASAGTVELAGNVGRPALDLLDEPPAELYVLELSSYQTADLQLGPRVVVLTNLYSEHLPWHGSYEAYRADKLRLAALPGVERVVASARDPELRRALAASAVPVAWFGVDGGYDVAPLGIVHGGRLVLARADWPLPGDHNALNLCAALAGLESLGLEEPALPAALAGFRALPHRLEVLGEHAGRRWVNDSISTTPESTIAGLESFRGASDITLLAGGLDRGQDFGGLGRELAARAARLVTLPDTGPRIAAAARAAGLPDDHIAAAGGLGEAVEAARRISPEGAVVLLSPAGASQPHYRDFEERGEHLRQLVTGQPAAPAVVA